MEHLQGVLYYKGYKITSCNNTVAHYIVQRPTGSGYILCARKTVEDCKAFIRRHEYNHIVEQTNYPVAY